MQKILVHSIDFFYPLVQRFVSRQTFRYIACGLLNTAFGLLLFTFCVYVLFKNRILNLGFYALEPHSAALAISSISSFGLGFLLNKFVVFTGSHLRGRVQLFRYFLSFATNLLLNYLILKLLIEKWEWEPFVSQFITIVIITLFSYLSQKHFTFKTHKDNRY